MRTLSYKVDYVGKMQYARMVDVCVVVSALVYALTIQRKAENQSRTWFY